MEQFPVTPYRDAAASAPQYWPKAAREFALPYHPNVTVGWDSSPRTVQSDVFANSGYRYIPVLGDNTPAAFEDSLAAAKRFVDNRPEQPNVLNINAWNEWTEGGYLEPGTEHGMEYLEAVKRVFG